MVIMSGQGWFATTTVSPTFRPHQHVDGLFVLFRKHQPARSSRVLPFFLPSIKKAVSMYLRAQKNPYCWIARAKASGAKLHPHNCSANRLCDSRAVVTDGFHPSELPFLMFSSSIALKNSSGREETGA